MKTGEEIGLHIVKCENKIGSDNIKDIQYSINEVLFPLSKMYISSLRADRILAQLIDLGTQLSALECKETALAKKNEILSQLRDMCKALKHYRKSDDCDDDREQMDKVLKYAVSQYLKYKDSYTIEDIIKALKRHKLLCIDYKSTLPSLKKSQDELLSELEGEFKIGS